MREREGKGGRRRKGEERRKGKGEKRRQKGGRYKSDGAELILLSGNPFCGNQPNSMIRWY
jgi:hypothetical protein